MAVSTEPDPPTRSLAFGLDRIGLLALRHPRWSVVGALIIAVVGIYGFFNITIDRDLRNLFRGDTEIFRTYSEAASEFVDPENQILVLIEGDIGSPEHFALLRDLQLELQLVPEVGSVFSPFSLRTPPDENGGTRPLIAAPEQGLDAGLIEAVRAHPLAGETLLSEDGTVLLYTVTHIEPKASLDAHEALINDVRDAVDTTLLGSGLETRIAGFAAIRTEIVRLLRRDQIVLNGSGVLIGFLLSLLMFRSAVGALITAGPAAIAGLTILSWSGALGIPVTVLSNVVPALVIVLGFADGMHLTASWRRFRAQGHSVVEAERLALIEVGPACMLTALTTAVAFLSMTISDVGIVRDFGWTGAIGTIVGAAIVLIGHGLGVRFLGRFWRDGHQASPIDRLANPSASLARGVTGRARGLLSAIAMIAVVGFGFGFFLVPPENSVSENLPSNSPFVKSLDVIDAKLGGGFPVQLIVPLEENATSGASLARVRAVHEAVDGLGASRPLSLWSLAEWAGVGEGDDLDALIEQLPESLRQLFIGPSGALVTVNIVEVSTHETLDILDHIEAAAVEAMPGTVITGATVLGAREASRTISNLTLSLFVAVIVALVLMMAAVRSIGAGLVAALPNLLPIFAVATLLLFVGEGMQMTSVVSLTIAFGVGIDDTIHFINAYLQTNGRTMRDRLVTAAHRVGPILIGTTVALMGGLTMTQTSGLATVANFGLLAISSLAIALIADLVFLPALMAGPFRRMLERKKDDSSVRSDLTE